MMNRPCSVMQLFDLYHDYEEVVNFTSGGFCTIGSDDMYEIYIYICSLEDRINKAIEYLNLYSGYDNNYCLDYHDLGKLVEILKGDKQCMK